MTVFLCRVFHFVSQANMTVTIPPVIVVCIWASTTTMTVTVVLISERQAGASGQHGVLPPPLIPRDTVRSVAHLVTVSQQQTQSQMPSQAYASYAMGPSQVSFLFQSWAFHLLYYIGVTMFLSVFRFQCGCNVYQWELSQSISMVGYIALGT